LTKIYEKRVNRFRQTTTS